MFYDKNGNVVEMEQLGFDYVFYQDPYNVHYPKEICSKPFDYSELPVLPELRILLAFISPSFAEYWKKQFRFAGQYRVVPALQQSALRHRT